MLRPPKKFSKPFLRTRFSRRFLRWRLTFCCFIYGAYYRTAPHSAQSAVFARCACRRWRFPGRARRASMRPRLRAGRWQKSRRFTREFTTFPHSPRPFTERNGRAWKCWKTCGFYRVLRHGFTTRDLVPRMENPASFLSLPPVESSLRDLCFFPRERERQSEGDRQLWELRVPAQDLAALKAPAVGVIPSAAVFTPKIGRAGKRLLILRHECVKVQNFRQMIRIHAGNCFPSSHKNHTPFNQGVRDSNSRRSTNAVKLRFSRVFSCVPGLFSPAFRGSLCKL